MPRLEGGCFSLLCTNFEGKSGFAFMDTPTPCNSCAGAFCESEPISVGCRELKAGLEEPLLLV